MKKKSNERTGDPETDAILEEMEQEGETLPTFADAPSDDTGDEDDESDDVGDSEEDDEDDSDEDEDSEDESDEDDESEEDEDDAGDDESDADDDEEGDDGEKDEMTMTMVSPMRMMMPSPTNPSGSATSA
jgi:hypothetical protein